MGTKVQIDSYMPEHCSMRDLSRESNGASWPSYYVDNNLPNGQFYYGFLPRNSSDSHPGSYDKDVMKQTTIEHEAMFKNRAFELHRFHQVQRDLMDEVRRKDQIKCPIPYDGSSSSSPVPSQMHHEDVQKWNGLMPPLANFVINGSILGTGTMQSSPHSTKGKSIQAVPSSFQNCFSPKDSEVSESRPTKVRRKMLDLQLPADEYIDLDEVEQCGDVKVVNNMTPSPNKNGKYFLNYHVKTECHGDAPRFDSHVTKSRVLADLNEPLYVDETPVSSVGFLAAAPSPGNVQYRGPTKLLGSSKDVPQSSVQRSLNGNSNNPSSENGSNGRDWLCYAIESEKHKGSVRSINKGTPWTSSQPMRSLNQLTQPPSFVTYDQIKGDPWKEKSVGNLEKPDRSFSLSSYNIPESILSSHAPNQPSPFYSSDLGMTWDQCGSSWSKPCAFSSQKLHVSSSPFLNSNALSKNHQSSTQSNSLFVNEWNLNNIPGNNTPFAGESSTRNGFYQGSSSSIKELRGQFPPNGFDYHDNSVPCSTINYVKPRTCVNGSPVKDMNLYSPLSNGVSDVQTFEPDCKIVGSNLKSTDPLAVLPWLRGNNHTVKVKKTETGDFPNRRKILGVSIFEKLPTPKKENPTFISSSAIHHQLGKEESESSFRKGGFDMNLPCELSDSELDTMNLEVIPTEKRTLNESADVRNHFDLNLCVTEEESPCRTTTLRGDTGIDLEAPVMVESEEDVLVEKVHVKEEPEEMKPGMPPDQVDNEEAELAKSAAEMIVAMSSSVTCIPPVEASEEEMFRWFVDVACSSGNDPESHMTPDQRDDNRDKDQDCLPEGSDDYESMVLGLKECNVEEYFPKPSVPEFLNIEENGQSALTTRTRRLHARRGRQRRDFQRDILPGLTSLSRHEVTEDLQTCGGLMRATGHPWHSAPIQRNATRNGCGRGRRRSVVAASARADAGFCPSKQILSSNTEVVLEDRCLTGWGKTTRRPRRQRCLAGNPPPPMRLS